jgi:hypothetical protein
MKVIGPRRGGRMIDVGCGFGFACDIAKRVSGWEVVGVEPSHYGELGAKVLELDIIRDYIDENHPISQVKYDLFHASEVIEHLDDPLRFLRLARKLLNPGGVAVMTTPLAEMLSADISDEVRYAMLSPSAHGFLFSRDALLNLFSESGFSHFRHEMRGTSIAVYASDAPIEIHAVDAPALVVQYARAILDAQPEPGSLRDGMVYRAFSTSVAAGRFADAAQFLPYVEEILTYTPRAHASFADFMTDYRSFVGPLYFFHGSYCLNHLSDFARARRSLLLGHEICKEKIALHPQCSQVDAGVVWLAALYAGIASLHAGDKATARHTFDGILQQPVGVFPSVPADVRAQAVAYSIAAKGGAPKRNTLLERTVRNVAAVAERAARAPARVRSLLRRTA